MLQNIIDLFCHSDNVLNKIENDHEIGNSNSASIFFSFVHRFTYYMQIANVFYHQIT